MSRLGRWCAAGAVVLLLLTVATWNLGDESDGAPLEAATSDSRPADTEAAVTAPATTPPATAALVDGSPDGADLFVAKGCASCHIGPDTRPFIDGFPKLDNAAVWAGTRKDGMTAEEYLTESLLSPSAFRSPQWNQNGGPTDGMPSLFLSEEEVDALVAYLLDE